MSDIEHLPVRPNIGIQKNNNSRLRPKINDHNNNIFNDTIDPDVKRVISKNDSIDNESQVTREERITKGIKTLRTAERKNDESTKNEKVEEPKNQWSSWIIISLAVIIIVLIIVIIYYVIQYNTTLLDKTIIPENIIRPSQNVSANYMQPMQTIAQIQQEGYQNQQNVAPVKPKNFVDPTKNDLMSALKKLNKPQLEKIVEVEEPIEIKDIIEPVKNVAEIQGKKIVELVDEDNEEDNDKEEKLMTHMNTTLEDLIFNDDAVDAFGENEELFSNSDD